MEITVRDVAVHHHQRVCELLMETKDELDEIMELESAEGVTKPGELVCKKKNGRRVYSIFCGAPEGSKAKEAFKVYARYEGLRHQSRIWHNITYALKLCERHGVSPESVAFSGVALAKSMKTENHRKDFCAATMHIAPKAMGRGEVRALTLGAAKQLFKIKARLDNGGYRYVREWKEKRETERAERQQQMADTKSGREPVTV